MSKKWSFRVFQQPAKGQLEDMLNLRINHLISSRFTQAKVCHQDILPREIDRSAAIDYMLDRTMMRPRDLILFFNFCIQKAADRPQITVQMIRDAEGEYSRARLRSLGDEWAGDYPNLVDFALLLQNQKKQFSIGEFPNAKCEEFCLDFLVKAQRQKDALYIDAERLMNQEISAADFKRTLVQVFYRVGLLGLKLQTSQPVTWTTIRRRSVSFSEISDETVAVIHPLFWRVLNVENRR